MLVLSTGQWLRLLCLLIVCCCLCVFRLLFVHCIFLRCSLAAGFMRPLIAIATHDHKGPCRPAAVLLGVRQHGMVRRNCCFTHTELIYFRGTIVSIFVFQWVECG